jgi:hypothetical protein
MLSMLAVSTADEDGSDDLTWLESKKRRAWGGGCGCGFLLWFVYSSPILASSAKGEGARPP